MLGRSKPWRICPDLIQIKNQTYLQLHLGLFTRSQVHVIFSVELTYFGHYGMMLTEFCLFVCLFACGVSGL